MARQRTDDKMARPEWMKYTIEELLEDMGEENQQGEFDWGDDQGKERSW